MELNIECEVGDLFYEEIERVIKDSNMQVVGEHWKMFGKWIYVQGIGLIGLLSRPYKAKDWTGAYATRKGYEEVVNEIRGVA